MSEIKLNQIPINGKLFCRECEREINPWRKIESADDLPKESGTYLVTMSDGENREVTMRRFRADMPFEKWEFSDTVSNWKVIAWMPLPEPFEG